MADYDVFNGDADGMCALHQLRLDEPRNAELITGVKRDISLLARVAGRVVAGDRLTVLDIAVEPNAEALRTVLLAGSRVRWFDHHAPGTLPIDPGLDAMIDLSSETCTSLLVDRHLHGQFRAWAIVAAYGDGLTTVAERLATEAGYDGEQAAALARLGAAINYNAYGETIADLFIAPDEAYRRLAPFEDPLAFVRDDPVAGELASLMSMDLEYAEDVDAALRTGHCVAYILPDSPWARRVNGQFANVVAQRNPGRAVAVLVRKRDGHYLVSVRAPVDRPAGADELCRKFPTGGGRRGAGGVNHLPTEAVPRFMEMFSDHFRSIDAC